MGSDRTIRAEVIRGGMLAGDRHSRGQVAHVRHTGKDRPWPNGPAPGGAQYCRCLVTAQADYTLPSVVPDVARIGIDHGEEAADALPVLLH